MVLQMADLHGIQYITQIQGFNIFKCKNKKTVTNILILKRSEISAISS